MMTGPQPMGRETDRQTGLQARSQACYGFWFADKASDNAVKTSVVNLVMWSE